MKKKKSKIKEQILNKLEGEKEFGDLYNIYVESWYKNHDSGEPVSYKEWVDNELEELRLAYRRYLKEAVLEDDGFDERSVEDFDTFCEEEIVNPVWEN